MDAYDALAVFASVPFAHQMTGDALRLVIETATVPDGLKPHVHRAFAEAHITMIARLLDAESDHPASVILQNIQVTAKAVGEEERIKNWLRG